MNFSIFRLKAVTAISIFFFVLLSNPVQAGENQACSESEYRQFDFWIGDWEVKDKNNKIVGHNKIFAMLNGCALSENWKSVNGNPGVSYNFYDKAENKWHQTWIDQGGNPLYLDGKFKDGKMVLAGYRPDAKGKTIKHKITWTPMKDGRVKQHWQASADEGKTWSEVFVGFYSRK